MKKGVDRREMWKDRIGSQGCGAEELGDLEIGKYSLKNKEASICKGFTRQVPSAGDGCMGEE